MSDIDLIAAVLFAVQRGELFSQREQALGITRIKHPAVNQAMQQ